MESFESAVLAQNLELVDNLVTCVYESRISHHLSKACSSRVGQRLLPIATDLRSSERREDPQSTCDALLALIVMHTRHRDTDLLVNMDPLASITASEVKFSLAMSSRPRNCL